MKRVIDFSQKCSVNISLARTMRWKGRKPVVNCFTKTYKKGVRLTKAAMNKIENLIHRVRGIEKWAVDILCNNELSALLRGLFSLPHIPLSLDYNQGKPS